MQKLAVILKRTLWLTTCLSFVATVFANDSEFTTQLIESRLTTLRVNGVAATDETVKAYEAAHSRLREAASHDHDTASYVDALTTAPQREAEIQLRMDAFESVESPLVSYSGLSFQELGEQIRLVRAELLEAVNARDRIDQSLANRETNANLSHSRLESIFARLSELAGLDVRIELKAPPSLDEGLQWLALAEQVALSAERRAQQARLASQPASPLQRPPRRAGGISNPNRRPHSKRTKLGVGVPE